MKHLKKDTGGYALLYVLVIVMVLAAISMMICTVALRNLQSQETAVERMADKYAAQGEIERIKAKIEAVDTICGYGGLAAAKAAYEIAAEISLGDETKKDGLYCYDVELKKTKNDTTVTAVLRIALEIDLTENDSDTPDVNKEAYAVKLNSVTFTSYTIEKTGGDAG